MLARTRVEPTPPLKRPVGQAKKKKKRERKKRQHSLARGVRDKLHAGGLATNTTGGWDKTGTVSCPQPPRQRPVTRHDDKTAAPKAGHPRCEKAFTSLGAGFSPARPLCTQRHKARASRDKTGTGCQYKPTASSPPFPPR